MFRGTLVADFLEWAAGGLVVGGIYGYVVAEVFNRVFRPPQPRDVVWVANRDAYRGAIFLGLVALAGHALRAIFY